MPPRFFEQEGSFSCLYEHCARDMRVYFAQRVFDPELSTDLVGETFAKAFEGRSKCRAENLEHASAWVFGIARHELARYFRKGRASQAAFRRLRLERPDLEPDEKLEIEADGSLGPLRIILRNELGRLPETTREAVLRRVIEGSSYDEIARAMSISQTAARARVSRGLRRLERDLRSNPDFRAIDPQIGVVQI